MPPALTSILPTTGLTTGGLDIVVVGTGLIDTGTDDDFADGVINPAKWNVVTVGTGSVVEALDRITLDTGANAGSGGFLNGAHIYNDFDLRALVTMKTPYTTTPPAGDVQLMVMTISQGARLVEMLFWYDFSASGAYLTTTIYNGVIAVRTQTVTSPITQDQQATLRMVRVGSWIWLYVDSTLIWKVPEFSNPGASVGFGVSNNAQAYVVTSWLEDYKFYPLLASQDNFYPLIADVDATRLRAKTPIVPLRGVSDVVVTNYGGTDTLTDGFMFTYPETYEVDAVDGISLYVTGNDLLR